MSRPRSSRSARIATAAILALALTLSTPAFAAGPFTDLGDTLTSWMRTWLAPFFGPSPDSGDLEVGAPTSRSSRSIDEGIPVPTATDGSPDACELGCPEAGPIGDPDG
jgi:hypothetical protein